MLACLPADFSEHRVSFLFTSLYIVTDIDVFKKFFIIVDMERKI